MGRIIKQMHIKGEREREREREKEDYLVKDCYLPLNTCLPWSPQWRWLARQSAAGHPGELALLRIPVPRSTSYKGLRVSWADNG